MVDIGFQDYSYSIQGGETIYSNVVGDVVAAYATSGDLYISFDDGPLTLLVAGLKYKAPDGETFKKFKIVNKSGSTRTATIIVGRGDIIDSRLTFSASVTISTAGSLLSVADASVTTTAAQVLAGNANRKGVVLKNLDTSNNIRIGDSNITNTRGHRLGPLESITLEVTDGIYAKSESGTNSLSIVEVRS